jgi:hypothetical protein
VVISQIAKNEITGDISGTTRIKIKWIAANAPLGAIPSSYINFEIILSLGSAAHLIKPRSFFFCYIFLSIFIFLTPIILV